MRLKIGKKLRTASLNSTFTGSHKKKTCELFFVHSLKCGFVYGAKMMQQREILELTLTLLGWPSNDMTS